jgi:hypothetical protein
LELWGIRSRTAQAFQDFGEHFDRRRLKARYADNDAKHPLPRFFEMRLGPPKPDRRQR